MKQKTLLKNFSIWEWFAMIATCVLIIAIVLTAIIIANKKQALDELKEKNEEITQSESFQNSNNKVLKIYLTKINNQL